MSSPSGDGVTTFPIRKVQELLRKAAKVRSLALESLQKPDSELNGSDWDREPWAMDESPFASGGWSKSLTDPMDLLGVFASLHIKDGFVLRAYQFRAGGNGNAVVWAMPKDAEFPDPSECPRLADSFLDAPKPTEALDDLMDAVEGDDSAWSYLCASLFVREISEYGAMWHGCEWSTHSMLGSNPFKRRRVSRKSSPDRCPSGDADEWTWVEPEPTEWRPSVCHEAGRVTVAFHTFCCLGVEAIYRHVDVFPRGSFKPRTERSAIATGPGGYVF